MCHFKGTHTCGTISNKPAETQRYEPMEQENGGHTEERGQQQRRWSEEEEEEEETSQRPKQSERKEPSARINILPKLRRASWVARRHWK